MMGMYHYHQKKNNVIPNMIMGHSTIIYHYGWDRTPPSTIYFMEPLEPEKYSATN